MLIKNTNMRICLLGVAMLTILLAVGCDRKGENIPTGFPTVNSLEVEGWTFFQNAQYTKAIEAFVDLKNRDASNVSAYNGLGWSYTRTSEYTAAEQNFQLLLSLTDDEKLVTDAYAGLAMMFFSTPKELAGDGGQTERNVRDQQAINYINQVLERDNSFTFEYDDAVNVNSLKKVIAQCLFNRQEFLQCIQYIESNFNPDYFQSLVESGIIVKVENDTITAGISANSEVSGQANCTVTKNGAEIELIRVLSVKHPDFSEVNYEIVSFTQGSGEVVFQGNPIPEKDQKFLIDYYYTPDFGTLLAEIMKTLKSE